VRDSNARGTPIATPMAIGTEVETPGFLEPCTLGSADVQESVSGVLMLVPVLTDPTPAVLEGGDATASMVSFPAIADMKPFSG